MSKNTKQQKPLDKILASDDAFGWDVQVAPPASGLTARLLLSMVRQVNRRGRVRYFTRYLHRPWDGLPYYVEDRWAPVGDGIRGVDDLPTFIHGALADEWLVVSFEDRSDARALARDLDALIVTERATRILRQEAGRRLSIAEAHIPTDYPDGTIYKNELERARSGWSILVAAQAQSASMVEEWTRRNVRRYTACVWQKGNVRRELRGGYEVTVNDVVSFKKSDRYYRLSVIEWQHLIDSVIEGAGLLYVRLADVGDYHAFDRWFGPNQFRGRKRKISRREIELETRGSD